MRKIAVVTGASAGIGLAVSKRFLDEGYLVFNLSRRESPLKGVTTLKTDLSSEESLDKALSLLKSKISKNSLISLVHNAFAYASDCVDDFHTEAVLKSFQVAILAPMHLNKALLPFMGEGSSILFLGSTLSEKSVPKAMTYSTLKHATVGLMRSVTQDLVNFKGVHSVCICPGFTRTEMLEEHLKKTKAHDSITEKVLFKRLVEPDEIANLVFFCAENPLVNGSVIHGNLGQVET